MLRTNNKRKIAALEETEEESDAIVKRPRRTVVERPPKEIFIVSSPLSVSELYPNLFRLSPALRVYQHWAVEVAGRYYELHQTDKESWISTEETVRTSKRIVRHRQLIGYTHDIHSTLRSTAEAIGATLHTYHLVSNNCQTFALRFHALIKCKCHTQTLIPPGSAQDVANKFKFAAIAVGPVLLIISPILKINPYVQVTAQVMAAGYCVWHERQARNGQNQLTDANYWRSQHRAQAEQANQEALKSYFGSLQHYVDRLPEQRAYEEIYIRLYSENEHGDRFAISASRAYSINNATYKDLLVIYVPLPSKIPFDFFLEHWF